MHILDIMPREGWIDFERELHEKFDLHCCAFDSEGARITDYVNWCNDICERIKATPQAVTNICATSNQHAMMLARQNDGHIVDECDAGLVKVCAPVKVDGELVGLVCGCGVLLGDEAEPEPFLVARSLDVDEEEVEAAMENIRRMTQDDADAIGRHIASRVKEIVAAKS